jgi:hypothetical protein
MLYDDRCQLRHRARDVAMSQDEHQAIREHLDTEIERLNCLYRGWPRPVAESEE